VNQELDPASWFSTRIQQIKSSTFSLLQFCCWNISQLEPGSGILASALLPHPHPHRSGSGSDSGHATPHPRAQASLSSQPRSVHQTFLSLATDLRYSRSPSRSMSVSRSTTTRTRGDCRSLFNHYPPSSCRGVFAFALTLAFLAWTSRGLNGELLLLSKDSKPLF